LGDAPSGSSLSPVASASSVEAFLVSRSRTGPTPRYSPLPWIRPSAVPRAELVQTAHQMHAHRERSPEVLVVDRVEHRQSDTAHRTATRLTRKKLPSSASDSAISRLVSTADRVSVFHHFAMVTMSGGTPCCWLPSECKTDRNRPAPSMMHAAPFPHRGVHFREGSQVVGSPRLRCRDGSQMKAARSKAGPFAEVEQRDDNPRSLYAYQPAITVRWVVDDVNRRAQSSSHPR
jgi:hypothetical protein